MGASKQMKYYVLYKVMGHKDETGADKQLKAGPYSGHELQAQANDIGGFEGVYDVHSSEAVRIQNSWWV